MGISISCQSHVRGVRRKLDRENLSAIQNLGAIDAILLGEMPANPITFAAIFYVALAAILYRVLLRAEETAELG